MSWSFVRAFAVSAMLLFGFALQWQVAAAQPIGAANMQNELQQPDAKQAIAQSPLVYAVRYRPGPNYRRELSLLQQDLREHGQYMARQTQSGVIIAAGPTFEEAGGLVLINVLTLAEAQAFMQNDPAVKAGVFAGEITDWRPVFDSRSLFRPQTK